MGHSNRLIHSPLRIAEGPLDVSDLLSKASSGDEHSLKTLLPLVYDELKALAAAQLAKDGDSARAHTLQPTALVHEAFLKMSGDDNRWNNRDHFMAVAATAMRHVLVDHSRRKNADKRGGGQPRADLSIEGVAEEASQSREFRVLWLDDLLTELTHTLPRAARIAEMRLFGGMEMEQIARVLDITRMTVHRDWQVARAWLAGKMQERGDDRDA